MPGSAGACAQAQLQEPKWGEAQQGWTPGEGSREMEESKEARARWALKACNSGKCINTAAAV